MENTDKSSIAMIGDEDLISGLKIFGFDVFFVNPVRNNPDKSRDGPPTARISNGVKDKDVRDIFREILEKDYKICFIQEIYFPEIKDLFLEIREKSFPLILLLPDHKEIKGLGRGILKELSIRAVGADVLIEPKVDKMSEA